MLTNLAKATTKVRKEIKSKPTTPAPTPAKASPAKGGAPTQPPYAAKAASPQHPSIVLEASAYTWPDDMRLPPANICTTINASLICSPSTQVRVSAIRWTPKGNLVLWGGANTTASQLTTVIPHISKALHPSLSAQAQSAPALPPTLCHNTKWSKLCLNSIPTGKSNQQGVYMPDEVHQALITETPSYASLTITQKLSWVHNPFSYSNGATSSLLVSFEDSDGSTTKALLHMQTLFTFRHVITVKHWKNTLPKPAPTNTPAPPQQPPSQAPGPVSPAGQSPHPSIYLHPSQVPPDPSWSPAKQAHYLAQQAA